MIYRHIDYAEDSPELNSYVSCGTKCDRLVSIIGTGREKDIYLTFQNLLNRLIQIKINQTQVIFYVRLIRSRDPVHVGRMDSHVEPPVVLGDPTVV